MPYPFSGILVRYRRRVAEVPCICSAARNSGETLASPNGITGSGQSTPESPPTPEPNTDAQPGTPEAIAKGGPQDSTRRESPTHELHVNLWEIDHECFMDIGMMIGDRDLTDAVQIDLPWKIDISDISDLGARLNGEKTIAAIFNEVVHYDGFAEGNFANISFRRDDGDFGEFTLLRLNSRFYDLQEVFLSDGGVVSQLTIRLPKPVDEHKPRAYIRLRIRGVPKEMYTSTFRQQDRSLLSSSTETRIVDFRINVRRGVPDELLSGYDTAQFPQFSKIHCFLTTERGDECVFQSKNYNGCRSLVDEDVWNEYIKRDMRDGVSPEMSVRNYLGYQWTASYKPSVVDKKTAPPPGVKDLAVLGRFSKTTSGPLYIARFLMLGLLFGVSGNALWSVLEPKSGVSILGRTPILSEDHYISLASIAIFLFLAFAIVAVTRENLNKLVLHPFQRLVNTICEKCGR
ncbi:hypothetical protein [Ralstonia pseudosolanacearum]|uniref:hypothetical protein n=1 Tax=Ralstonia pseudosolanacearum TaxID=1310165 RepID=UPI00339734A1